MSVLIMFTGLCSKLEPMRPLEQQQFWGGTLGWCRSAVQGGTLRDSFQILIKPNCLLALSASACSLRTLIGVLLFLCIAVTAAGSGIMASLFAQDGNPVKVVARIRPVNRMEREKGSHISVSTSSDTQIEIQVGLRIFPVNISTHAETRWRICRQRKPRRNLILTECLHLMFRK